MTTTHATAAKAFDGYCHARLLLASGTIVAGTFHYPSSTFRPNGSDVVYAVYGERQDGVLLLRSDHYAQMDAAS